MAEDQVMAEAVAAAMAEAVAAAMAEAVAAAMAETPETIEAAREKTGEAMAKIAMADAVDGNITKLKNKNRIN